MPGDRSGSHAITERRGELLAIEHARFAVGASLVRC